MQQRDFDRFGAALTALAELYGKSLSQGAIALWWQALERFDFEQVSKAIRAHTENAENGQFMPKPADLIRVLDGTVTDRAGLAWGKAFEAITAVGAYTDVVFDDPAIHAVIEDLGGWPKFCRGEIKDLGYLQHRFCESYRAYAGRGDFEYPRRLSGDRSPDDVFAKRNLPPPRAALVGDPVKAKQVYTLGESAGRVQISRTSVGSLASHALSQIADARRAA